MSSKVKSALAVALSALLGALGGWSAAPVAEPVACPECIECPAIIAPAPGEVVPAEVAPVVAPAVP
jgi:hypothetical protein